MNKLILITKNYSPLNYIYPYSRAYRILLYWALPENWGNRKSKVCRQG